MKRLWLVSLLFVSCAHADDTDHKIPRYVYECQAWSKTMPTWCDKWVWVVNPAFKEDPNAGKIEFPLGEGIVK